LGAFFLGAAFTNGWAQAGASPPPSGPAAAAPAAAANSAQEISTHDETPTFRVKVNLVLVRVVVRDDKGNAVGNLRKEDFQLLDNGKPQVIQQFTVEQAAKPAAAPAKPPAPTEQNAEELPPPVVPNHYVAYVFDDIHLAFEDLARVRDAATRHLATLAPTDRAAIFTTSGQGNLDFSDDHAKLKAALEQLRMRPLTSGQSGLDCPDLSYYQADLIYNKNDATALNVAMEEAFTCNAADQNKMQAAAATAAATGGSTQSASQQVQQDTERIARMAAAEVMGRNDHETRVSLAVLTDIVRRLSVMPGQRAILLLSPGFYAPEMQQEYQRLEEQALRDQVVISTLNARGLYTDQSVVASNSSPVVLNGRIFTEKMAMARDSALAEDNLLQDLSYGTGGTHFGNSNDFDDGFRRIAAPPEFAYTLGFSPLNLKLDGKFHRLQVTVKESPKLNIQARKGYYAPKQLADPAEEAKQEIEEALFSQEEMHDLPVELHTQFFKSGEAEAKLAVLAHIDVKRMHFQRTGERNATTLTIVSGLFDGNGKFVSGIQKVLEMRLKDDTLANKLNSGVTVKSSFDVTPGSYLVRLVVRDTEGELSAANGSIEIP
jgi:VWFA-related protein